MTTTSRAHAFTGSRTRIHTPPRRLEMHASATLSRARLPVGVFSRCVCFFEATSKKLSDSTLLGPLGVGTRRFNGVLFFFLSLSPSLVLRTAIIAIIIIIVEVVSRSCWIHRPFSMWIDLDRLWGCSSPRHAVDDAERESDKKREVVSSFPRRKEKKEKNQKSPSPPLFFLVFLGG